MSEHFTVSAVGVLEEGKLHTLFTSMFSHKYVGHNKLDLSKVDDSTGG